MEVSQYRHTGLLTHSQEDLQIVVGRTLGWLSLILSFLVAASFVTSPRQWKFPHVLMLCFAVSSCGMAFFLMLSFGLFPLHFVQDHEVLCIFQAVGVQFFGGALTWWWFCIGLNLYMIVVVEVEKPQKLLWVYHIICWGLSTIQTIIPGVFGRFGATNPFEWCWMKPNTMHIWHFATLYGQMGFCSIICIGLWARVIIVARRRHLEAVNGQDKFLVKPFVLRHVTFVGLFVGVFIVLCVNRVIFAIQTRPSFGLLIVSVVVLMGQGTLLFLAIGTSTTHLDHWRRAWGAAWRFLSKTVWRRLIYRRLYKRYYRGLLRGDQSAATEAVLEDKLEREADEDEILFEGNSWNSSSPALAPPLYSSIVRYSE
eukprot:TRINITY_DN16672_c0_g1_i1.p1 TRINITY_DN16672_c0_g1~~TRINITY_DN16672_c0_g1_i1.p1  ORF type:complete len:368 (-),score=26.23 TRINITY_DN16672_c0_g1_i1:56-1159(-)